MRSTLKIGDKVVYPAHGVGEVECIEKRDIAGYTQTFYVLRFTDSGMTVLVPTNNARDVGLREIIDAKQVNAVFRTLRKRGNKEPRVTWNRKHREYADKIKSGSIHEVADVFRELKTVSANKELSFSERKMLDTVRNLLVSEIACAKDCAPEEIDAKLDKIFADLWQEGAA